MPFPGVPPAGGSAPDCVVVGLPPKTESLATVAMLLIVCIPTGTITKPARRVVVEKLKQSTGYSRRIEM